MHIFDLHFFGCEFVKKDFIISVAILTLYSFPMLSKISIYCVVKKIYFWKYEIFFVEQNLFSSRDGFFSCHIITI